jgi:hypothetical protein
MVALDVAYAHDSPDGDIPVVTFGAADTDP